MVQALALLAGMPSRPTDEPELEREAYFIALEGATRWSLTEAVKAALRGKLGHAFLPSPPELRRLCNEAMQPHEEQRERILRRERQEREAAQFPDRVPPSEEAKARVSRAYAEYCARHEADKRTEPVQMRQYDPELLATIPDNPKFKERMGVKGVA